MFKYCPRCGQLLVDVPVTSSWERHQECKSCGLQVHIGYGDAMGGSSDQYHFDEKRSEPPLVIPPKPTPPPLRLLSEAEFRTDPEIIRTMRKIARGGL